MQQQNSTLELPVCVKKAIDAINTQIEYLTLIVNAPPPIHCKIELQYNKDEFLKIPNSILFISYKEILQNEISMKQFYVNFLLESFLVTNNQKYVQYNNDIDNISSYVVMCDDIKKAKRFSLETLATIENINDYTVINIYTNSPIPTHILNTINI